MRLIRQVHAQSPSPTDSPFGDIVLPDAWARWATAPGGEDGGALFLLINVGFRLVLIGAGLFALWKVIDAGFTFMTASGDSQKIAEGRDKLTWTLIGILIIFGSLVLVSVIGLIFFGSATIFINPEISEPPPISP